MNLKIWISVWKDWVLCHRDSIIRFVSSACIAFGLLVLAFVIGVVARAEDSIEVVTDPDTGLPSVVESVPETTVSVPETTTSPVGEAPVLLTADGDNSRASGYSPYADCTNSDSVASVLYDNAQTIMRPFNDFVLWRMGQYQYAIVFGSIDDDFTFKNCTLIIVDYSYSSGSNRRYTFSRADDVSGSFNPNSYTFLSNIDHVYSLNNESYIRNHRMYTISVALVILAVFAIFSRFVIFRGSRSL